MADEKGDYSRVPLLENQYPDENKDEVQPLATRSTDTSRYQTIRDMRPRRFSTRRDTMRSSITNIGEAEASRAQFQTAYFASHGDFHRITSHMVLVVLLSAFLALGMARWITYTDPIFDTVIFVLFAIMLVHCFFEMRNFCVANQHIDVDMDWVFTGEHGIQTIMVLTILGCLVTYDVYHVALRIECVDYSAIQVIHLIPVVSELVFLIARTIFILLLPIFFIWCKYRQLENEYQRVNDLFCLGLLLAINISLTIFSFMFDSRAGFGLHSGSIRLEQYNISGAFLEHFRNCHYRNSSLAEHVSGVTNFLFSAQLQFGMFSVSTLMVIIGRAARDRPMEEDDRLQMPSSFLQVLWNAFRKFFNWLVTLPRSLCQVSGYTFCGGPYAPVETKACLSGGLVAALLVYIMQAVFQVAVVSSPGDAVKLWVQIWYGWKFATWLLLLLASAYLFRQISRRVFAETVQVIIPVDSMVLLVASGGVYILEFLETIATISATTVVDRIDHDRTYITILAVLGIFAALFRMLQTWFQTKILLIMDGDSEIIDNIDVRMREAFCFLFFSNVFQWIISNFLEVNLFNIKDLPMEYYGQRNWFILNRLGLPLSYYYHMHSAIVLAKILHTQP